MPQMKLEEAASTAPTKPPRLIRITRNGQTTIPQPIRRRLGLVEGSYLTVEERDGAVVMRPQVIDDPEGRAAYLQAKADQKAGRLRGPYTTIEQGKTAVARARKRRTR